MGRVKFLLSHLVHLTSWHDMPIWHICASYIPLTPLPAKDILRGRLDLIWACNFVASLVSSENMLKMHVNVRALQADVDSGASSVYYLLIDLVLTGTSSAGRLASVLTVP